MYAVMPRLTVCTRKAFRKQRRALVLEFWMNILRAIVFFNHIVNVVVALQTMRRVRPRYSLINYDRDGTLYRLVYENDTTCIENLRMNTRSFTNLCGMLKTTGRLKDTKNMLVDEQVAMFLHILAHHVKNRVIKFIFRRSGETISRHFKLVCNAIIRLQAELLKKPEPISQNNKDEKWKWFKVFLQI